MMRKQMEEILINLLSCGIFEVIKNFIMKLQQRKQAAGRGGAVIQPAILPRTGRPAATVLCGMGAGSQTRDAWLLYRGLCLIQCFLWGTGQALTFKVT